MIKLIKKSARMNIYLNQDNPFLSNFIEVFKFLFNPWINVNLPNQDFSPISIYIFWECLITSLHRKINNLGLVEEIFCVLLNLGIFPKKIKGLRFFFRGVKWGFFLVSDRLILVSIFFDGVLRFDRTSFNYDGQTVEIYGENSPSCITPPDKWSEESKIEGKLTLPFSWRFWFFFIINPKIFWVSILCILT